MRRWRRSSQDAAVSAAGLACAAWAPADVGCSCGRFRPVPAGAAGAPALRVTGLSLSWQRECMRWACLTAAVRCLSARLLSESRGCATQTRRWRPSTKSLSPCVSQIQGMPGVSVFRQLVMRVPLLSCPAGARCQRGVGLRWSSATPRSRPSALATTVHSEACLPCHQHF